MRLLQGGFCLCHIPPTPRIYSSPMEFAKRTFDQCQARMLLG